jgi:hypothetical protein
MLRRSTAVATSIWPAGIRQPVPILLSFNGHPAPDLTERTMTILDYTFITLEGSDGLGGRVIGRGDCPEEGDYLMLPYEGQKFRYQVTFSSVDRERPENFEALVVRDPLPDGVELP